MKLLLQRNQADQKGIFGGHKGVNFSLFGKAEISEEERGLVNRYNVADHVLATCKRGTHSDGTPIEYRITVRGLVNGTTETTNSISTLLDLEDSIREACRAPKSLLEVMAMFGGQEVIEI